MKNENGFSLAGVVVASGLLGILAMGFTKLMESQAQASANFTTTFEINAALSRLYSTLLNSESCMNTIPKEDLRLSKGFNIIYNKSGKEVFNTSDKYGGNSIQFNSFRVVNPSLNSSQIEEAFSPNPIPSGDTAVGEVSIRVEITKTKAKVLGGKKILKYIPIKVEVDENYVPVSCYSSTDNAVETSKGEICKDLGGIFEGGHCLITGGVEYGKVIKEAVCELFRGVIDANGMCTEVHVSNSIHTPELHLSSISTPEYELCDKVGVVRYNNHPEVEGLEYCNGSRFVKIKGATVAQSCKMIRGGIVKKDAVLYCPPEKPLIFSCNANDDQAPDSTPTDLSGTCPTSGSCPMNTTRTSLGGDGFYLETVTNGQTQGCLAYDNNHSHTDYRLEITCCESI